MLKAARESWDDRHPRAPGLHMSDLIYCLRKAWYRRKGYPEPEQDNDAILLLGHGAHAILAGDGREVSGTLQFDGVEPIHWNMDRVWDETPVEDKTTRAGSNKPIADHYVEQLAGYCVAEEKTRGYLAIWHLLGDRKGPQTPETPVLKVHEIEFSQEELAEWRRELHTRALLVTDKAPPPLGDNYGWECGYCPFGPKGSQVCPGHPGRDQGLGQGGGFFQNHWWMKGRTA
jgi:CRISPR/Cas system-associated exonuclease Cas4 (RecB family)